MPTNPTAVYTRGWWPSALADPSFGIYLSGWLHPANVEIVAEVAFRLQVNDGVFPLWVFTALDRELKTVVGQAHQLWTSTSLELGLGAVLGLEFALEAGDEHDEIL